MSARWLEKDDVERDKLIWIAKYSDGIEFQQYKDGIAQSSELIDHKRLWILKLLDKNGKVVVSQEYRKGQKPFYRRRTALRLGSDVVEVIHIIGWRVGDIIHAAFVYESDLHVEMGEFRKDDEIRTRSEEWQYPIIFRDIDEVMVE